MPKTKKKTKVVRGWCDFSKKKAVLRLVTLFLRKPCKDHGCWKMGADYRRVRIVIEEL